MYRVTQEEQQEQLRNQVLALGHSCSSYDKDNLWEAPRLATIVYTMCHDPVSPRKNSLVKSLLGQLGLKNTMKFVSSRWALEIPPTVMPWLPLAVMRSDDTTNFHFAPILGAGVYEAVPFMNWYNESVFKIADGRTLSRRDLIFSLRSQDGGSHVDEFIRNDEYAILRHFNDARLQRCKALKGERFSVTFYSSIEYANISKDDDFEPIPRAHLATMRQIAWELLKTLEINGLHT